MAYATVDDLAERFPRPLTAAEEEAAEVLLDDASFLLSVDAPGLQAAIDGGNEDIIYAAKLLVVTMVARALQARAAQQTVSPVVDQVSQAFGPYSQSVKYSSKGGNLFLYADELARLLLLLGGESLSAVSMRSPGF